MADEDHTENWLLSSYPILMALLLLITTAISLGLGSSESYTNAIMQRIACSRSAFSFAPVRVNFNLLDRGEQTE
ncbi:MAG: hypothetical protein OIN66_11920 [Candidatus Methanoperedens sp.]|nr:hypothetical protein [Candidatus Methanoperedens sp.]